jgi:adenosylcobinamide-phosphate synthase
MPQLPSIDLEAIKRLLLDTLPQRELPRLTEFAGAVAFDLLLGEPPNRIHPVAAVGKAIDEAAKRKLPIDDESVRLAYGAFLAVGLPITLTKAAVAGTEKWQRRNRRLGLLARIYLLKCAFSLRKLVKEARAVRKALDTGDLDKARDRLKSLVSRDRSHLDRRQIISAVVESLAENLTDSIVAPWTAYVLAGLPGAVAYRTINTMDAMIGYHEGRLEQLGKAAARLDDLVNFLPARFTAVLIAAMAHSGNGDPGRAFRIMWRDHSRTESPNAGWTMSAMAGALGVQLENPGRYVIGDPTAPLTTEDIERAARIVYAVSTVMLVAVSTGTVAQAVQAWRKRKQTPRGEAELPLPERAAAPTVR